uniref:LITAF domain-containing protein n=1 Tax=Meloidogyne floridensis TaxID=298350 RepID=A0A915NII2_9BILA
MSHPQANAPPPYDSAQKYSAYPDINMQGDPYQPNMQNPYPQQQAPQQPAPTTTYVYVNDGQRPPFGPQPQNAFCPTCQQQVLTKVKHSAGLLTWLVFDVGWAVVYCHFVWMTVKIVSIFAVIATLSWANTNASE